MSKEIKFEYGFQSINGIVKKKYYLHEIPFIAEKCDIWNVLPIVYVRQFTGLVDKNGIEIYEGDKVSQYDSYEPTHYGTIVFYYYGFKIKLDNPKDNFKHIDINKTHCTKIGSIYDNPNLLA